MAAELRSRQVRKPSGARAPLQRVRAGDVRIIPSASDREREMFVKRIALRSETCGS